MPFVQGKNPILIQTPFGKDDLFVIRISGEERISAPFHYTVELVSEKNDLDFTKIVGKPATVTLPVIDGSSHYLSGVVGRFVQAGKNPRFTTYYADLHPWLWMTTMSSNCRIFQNQTVPDIIKKVFNDLGFTDLDNQLQGTYTPREYCVQWNETAFDFTSRLMEEEGIFYFFKHEESKHTMVLADAAAAHPACKAATVHMMKADIHSADDQEAITECMLEQQVTVGKYRSTDYNFETPSTSLLATSEGKDKSQNLYEWPSGYLKKDAVQAHSDLALAMYEVPGATLRGTSSCLTFRAGYKFTLEGHSREDINDSYVLKSVSMRMDQHTLYSNSFEAMPAKTPFRPAKITPKPKIYGAQTALVVGPSGEEIWTDKYGRIIVQFYWDQEGKKDGKSSCWIRVAQGWAGKQWGAIFLPRIGQEVLITFLDGNPDRPLITGSVYNAEQTVPYALPGEQTKSTIKSNSSKGGGGFNEFRFEDKKDSEEVFLQAQKDFNVKVLNDETDTIKNNRTATIQEKDETLIVDKGNRTVKVNKGTETHFVKGTRDLTVEDDETHTNKKNYSGKVTKNYTLKVDGDITIEATGSISIKSGKSFKNEAGMDFSNKSGTDFKNEAGTSMSNKAQMSIENNAQMSLTNKAGISMTNDAGMSLLNKGGLQSTVQGGALAAVKGGIVKLN